MEQYIYLSTVIECSLRTWEVAWVHGIVDLIPAITEQFLPCRVPHPGNEKLNSPG